MTEVWDLHRYSDHERINMIARTAMAYPDKKIGIVIDQDKEDFYLQHFAQQFPQLELLDKRHFSPTMLSFTVRRREGK